MNCNFQRCNLRGAIFGSYEIEIDRKKSVRYHPVALMECDFTGANLEEVNAENTLLTCLRSSFTTTTPQGNSVSGF